mmetsp:Transcript_42256/g.99229  ORF Transcript_42256/g.99229 Transcript_42256/m.99229 type:complete len:662 (+) Transcript_42256:67-2052(+)
MYVAPGPRIETLLLQTPAFSMGRELRVPEQHVAPPVWACELTVGRARMAGIAAPPSAQLIRNDNDDSAPSEFCPTSAAECSTAMQRALEQVERLDVDLASRHSSADSPLRRGHLTEVAGPEMESAAIASPGSQSHLTFQGDAASEASSSRAERGAAASLSKAAVPFAQQPQQQQLQSQVTSAAMVSATSSTCTPWSTALENLKQTHKSELSEGISGPAHDSSLDVLRQKLPTRTLEQGTDVMRRLNWATTELCAMGFQAEDAMFYFEPLQKVLTKSSQALLELKGCEPRAAGCGLLQELLLVCSEGGRTHSHSSTWSGAPVQNGFPPARPCWPARPQASAMLTDESMVAQAVEMGWPTDAWQVTTYAPAALPQFFHGRPLDADVWRDVLRKFRNRASEELEYMNETASAVLQDFTEVQKHMRRCLVCLARVDEACMQRRATLSAENCMSCIRGVLSLFSQQSSAEAQAPPRLVEDALYLPRPAPEEGVKGSARKRYEAERIASVQSFSHLTRLEFASQLMRKVTAQVLPVAEELMTLWNGVLEGIVAAEHAVSGLDIPKRRNVDSGGSHRLALAAGALHAPPADRIAQLEQLLLVHTALSNLSVSLAAFLIILDTMKVLPANMDISSVIGREKCAEIRSGLLLGGGNDSTRVSQEEAPRVS